MPQEHILVVDDEADILELVRYNLTKEGYEVTCALSGEEAVELARIKKPNLIILDLMLPGMDGLTVCRELKKHPRTENIPIVILTAKGEEADILHGFELGADNYVVKPFSPKILVARIRALLRSKRPRHLPTDEVIEIDQLQIHAGRHEVRVHGVLIDLTSTEFRILQCLALKPGWVFTRHQIVNLVQGDDVAVTDRSIDVHIVALRKKLGTYATQIETVRGVGYRFRDGQESEFLSVSNS